MPCEKPRTHDPVQAWDLVRIARETDRNLLLANGYDYLPGIDDLCRRIGDGLVGDIEHVMASFVSATRNVFLGDKGLRSWDTAFFRPDRSTWQDPAQGGGFADGPLSHSLALMVFRTGLWPRETTAFTFARADIDLANAAE